mmetsp:Transcript_19415/g.29393  ORF Transcript_19415/g.29393 Transcript_19415/m.29393 type:complete len:148 (+) Transcript_19415:124-567(+)
MFSRISILLASIVVLSCACFNHALVAQPSRRAFFSASTAAATAIIANNSIMGIAPAKAEEGVALTEEEMAARIAKKQELLRRAKSGEAPPAAASDIRSDVNPSAGVNLRNRSLAENAKNALDKQKEMEKRDKRQKREDLCEMLGRGC